MYIYKGFLYNYFSNTELRMLDKEDIAVFEKAAQIGIHRTVHAGEGGPALMVWKVSLTLLLHCYKN